MILGELTSDSVEGFDEPYSDSEDEENLSVTDTEEEWDISPQVRYSVNAMESQWSSLGQHFVATVQEVVVVYHRSRSI